MRSDHLPTQTNGQIAKWKLRRRTGADTMIIDAPMISFSKLLIPKLWTRACRTSRLISLTVFATDTDFEVLIWMYVGILTRLYVRTETGSEDAG